MHHCVSAGWETGAARVARGGLRLPRAGRDEGRADPRGPRERRSGDRGADRGGDARPARRRWMTPASTASLRRGGCSSRSDGCASGSRRCATSSPRAATTLHLQPDRVERVVATALALARQPSLQPGAEPGTYVVPALTGSWSRATIGLEHPARPDERRPITFDHEIARDRTDVVLAHLGHPLVRMALALLRAEVWGTGHHLHRVTLRYAQPSLGAAGGGRARSAGDHRRERTPAARAADLRRAAADRRAPGAPRGAGDRGGARARARHAGPGRPARPADPAAARERRRAAGGAAGAGRRPRPPADGDAGRPRPGGAGARRGDPQRAGGNDPPQALGRAWRSAAAVHRPRARRRRASAGRAGPALAAAPGSTRSPSRSSAEQAAIARRYAEPAHRLFPAAVTLLVPEGARI